MRVSGLGQVAGEGLQYMTWGLPTLQQVGQWV